MTVGVPGWIRANLFSSPIDGIITIVLGIILALAVFQSINWVFFTASWEVITTRIPLYIIGRYPHEFYWRPLTALLLISVLLGMTWRMWGGLARGFAIALIIVTLLAGLLPYAGVDLGAPRHDSKIELETPSATPPQERQRDISDADPAFAKELKEVNLTGTLYELGTLDDDEDRTDYYTFTLEETRKLTVGLWQLDGTAKLTLEDQSNRPTQIAMGISADGPLIEDILEPGTYFVRIDAEHLTTDDYVLSYSFVDPPDHLVNALFVFNIVAVVIGFGLAALPSIGTFRNFIIIAAVFFIVSAVLVIGSSYIPGLDPVPTQDLGGLTLNLLLAGIGIVCSIPIGILLALGRRSRLPFLKIFCVGFIEIIRGVPLITLLFMSRHILPLTFPETVSIDELYLAMITITFFSSAYMAENVRGGMAAVATGQTEAAHALGLRAWQTTLLITLPQGLRNIIPAIVGQAISLFKDTSLVFIIGMLDLVEMGRVTIQGNLDFIDDGHEVYIFIAAIFWIFTFSMSYVSRRIERALGVGRR